jgi:hypothetical protein
MPERSTDRTTTPDGSRSPALEAPAPPAADAVRVVFSSPDEFLQELRRRGPNVEPLLRLTLRWTRDESGAPIHHLSVVAGYLRRANGVVTLTSLRHYVGGLWVDAPDTAPGGVRERAASLRDRIEQEAGDLGLEIAAGAYDTGAAPNGC